MVAPKEGWVLHEFGLVTHQGLKALESTDVGRVEYQRSSTGELQPTRVEYRTFYGTFAVDPETLNPPIRPAVGTEFRYADFRFGGQPRPEFTLTSYGLPEFGQTVAQAEATRSFPWWTVAAALGFAAFAVILRRWTGRRAITPAPPTG